jgi:hypothetical protein
VPLEDGAKAIERLIGLSKITIDGQSNIYKSQREIYTRRLV